MRTLTSIQSATNILLDLELHVEAADVSTTWIFDSKDIVVYPDVKWEMDYTGGVSKPADYRITLATSISFLSDNRQKLIRGRTFLKVFVNSDNFTPHVGRITGMERDAGNLNLVQLTVYDEFFDGNPCIPQSSITDSYSTLHPAVSGIDMGYPLYYGKHTRPFYMTPVDCSIKSLLGPRNVSSANHVGSMYYFVDPVENKRMYFASVWAQQSGSTNTASNSIPFEVHEESVSRPLALDTGELSSVNAFEQVINAGYRIRLETKVDTLSSYTFWEHSLKKRLSIKNATKFYGSDISSFTIGTITFHGFIYTIGDSVKLNFGSATTSHTLINAINVTSLNIFGEDKDYGVGVSFIGTFSADAHKTVAFTSSYDWWLQLKSDAYANYSIFASQVNCSEIAISENPNKIVADLIDQTSFIYNSAQNSTAQADTTSYNFQCFMGERRPLSDIMVDFGNLTGTYYWIGDSGFINTRTYQESATVTSSINYTLTTTDIQMGSLKIKDDPIGSIFYQTNKAKRIKFDYGYNFSTGKYSSNQTVDQYNNAFCSSAAAAGVQNEINPQTTYVLESDTASFCLNNYVRRNTISETILEGKLPARFMGMELADIIQLTHPALLNGQSLFQVTKVDPNYRTGDVGFTANEIINLD